MALMPATAHVASISDRNLPSKSSATKGPRISCTTTSRLTRTWYLFEDPYAYLVLCIRYAIAPRIDVDRLPSHAVCLLKEFSGHPLLPTGVGAYLAAAVFYPHVYRCAAHRRM